MSERQCRRSLQRGAPGWSSTRASTLSHSPTHFTTTLLKTLVLFFNSMQFSVSGSSTTICRMRGCHYCWEFRSVIVQIFWAAIGYTRFRHEQSHSGVNNGISLFAQ